MEVLSEPKALARVQLLELPQLVATPHIGGNSVEAVEAMGRAAIAHLKTFFNCE